MSRPTRLLRLRLAAPLALFLLLPSVLALGASDAPETVLDVSGLTFVGSRGMQNELVLRAVRARFHPERNTAQLEQVHAVVQREGEAPGFEITCDRADLDLDTNDFRAEGNVHGSTADGRRFRSDWVKYASE